MIRDPFLPMTIRISVWFLLAVVIVLGWMAVEATIWRSMGWERAAFPPAEYWAAQFWSLFVAGCSRPAMEGRAWV